MDSQNKKFFRATIYVDLEADSPKIASEKLKSIVKSIPNSFTDGHVPLLNEKTNKGGR